MWLILDKTDNSFVECKTKIESELECASMMRRGVGPTWIHVLYIKEYVKYSVSTEISFIPTELQTQQEEDFEDDEVLHTL